MHSFDAGDCPLEQMAEVARQRAGKIAPFCKAVVRRAAEAASMMERDGYEDRCVSFRPPRSL